MVSVALEAASLLEAKGLSVGVADMWSLKPLDEDFVLKYASSVSAIVTLEEHSVVNGLGSAVADVLAQHHSRARLTKLGLPDAYPPECIALSGDAGGLWPDRRTGGCLRGKGDSLCA